MRGAAGGPAGAATRRAGTSLPKRAHAAASEDGGAVDVEAFKRLKIGHCLAQPAPWEQKEERQLVLYRGGPAQERDGCDDRGGDSDAFGLLGGASLARASLAQLLTAPVPLLRSDARGRELVPYVGGGGAPRRDLRGRGGDDDDEDDDDDDLHRMECD